MSAITVFLFLPDNHNMLMNYLTANIQVDFTLPRFCLDYQILIFKT